MAESDAVDDFSKSMRPTTPNEVAAIMRNRLCQNKYRQNMNILLEDKTRVNKELIKRQMEVEHILTSIRSTTGTSFKKKKDDKDDKYTRSEYSRPPSYMDNYLDMLRTDKSKKSGIKPTIEPSKIRSVPFVRPHSVITRTKVSSVQTNNTQKPLTSREHTERKVKSEMSCRPMTAPSKAPRTESISNQIQKVIDTNTNSPSINVKKVLKEDIKPHSIEDDKLRAIYINVCRERDSIPQHSVEKKELLKKIDPVFAKRYKEYKSSVVAGHAPHFNLNDHNLLHSMKTPKKKIDRQKQGIITLLSCEKHKEPQKMIRQERSQFDLRVKMFIRSLAELS